MRYLIRFSYDGTKFHGFQRQKDVKNVQGTIEKALSEVLKENIVIKGAGRTDALVHALDQCAHFDTFKKISKDEIKRIKELLANEIVIKKWQIVDNNFHARHSVSQKTYTYKIYLGKPRDVLKGYYYQIPYDLDIVAMKKAIKLFIGTHDFKNYVSGPRLDYTSTIFKADLKQKGKYLSFTFTGVGFYRYMVRHLVGTLINIGKKKMSLEDLKASLDSPSEVITPVAPAEGLYLVKIKY